MRAFTQSRSLPILLLLCSNIFMTFAWYGHLKFKSAPLWLVIIASWGIAFFEYCLMVPANRWGNNCYSAVELKIIQEIITLSVFSGFAILYLGANLKWNHKVAFVLMVAAAGFTFLPDKSNTGNAPKSALKISAEKNLVTTAKQN
jgi:hypothetical protein